MKARITVKNYRCFPDARPARFVVADGATAFVGVNNAGKSSLLKLFFEFRPLFAILSSPNGSILGALGESPPGFNKPESSYDIEDVFSNTNERDLEIDIRFEMPAGISSQIAIPNRAVVTLSRTSRTWTLRYGVDDAMLDLSAKNLSYLTPGGGTPMVVAKDGKSLADLAFLFEQFARLRDTVYIGAFRNAINAGGAAAYYDICVGQDFIRAWGQFKQGPNNKNRQAAHRVEDDIRRLLRYSALQINPSHDDQTLEIAINGRSYMLPDLGAGIAQFILVLINAATKQPALILIDEPELNLHPTLQLEFLATLGRYATTGVLFSTHNYWLTRAAAHRVYLVSSISDGVSEVVEQQATVDLSGFLRELGFSGYRDMGFKKILLVEGPTDTAAVRALLAKYGKDTELVVLSLGGGAMINGSREHELEEIKRITPHVAALVDSERKAADEPLSRERRDFQRACETAGIRCHILERRALENYFTERAIQRVTGHGVAQLGGYELLGKGGRWSKSENWEIAREMSLEELETTDLGAFLRDL